MLINDLIKEKKELHQIRENHLKELFAWNNPSGILVCHKHSNWISWKKRDIRKAGRQFVSNYLYTVYTIQAEHDRTIY